MNEREAEVLAIHSAEVEPAMVRLSRELYPEGSYGQILFPNILEGRVRHATYADLPCHFGPQANEMLRELGVETLADVFSMQETALENLPRGVKNHIEKRLPHYVDSLAAKFAYSPHAKLVNAALGVMPSSTGPVEPKDEPELARLVDATIGVLRERDAELLRMRFGLDTGIPASMEETARHFKISRERVRQIEARGLSRLRHSTERQNLTQFLAFPIDSIGRQLGYVYHSEVATFPLEPGEMGLTDDVVEEVRSHRSWWGRPVVQEILELSARGFTPDAQAQLTHRLQQAVRANAQYEIFGDILDDVTNVIDETAGVKLLPTKDLPLPLSVKSSLPRGYLGTLGTLLKIDEQQTGLPEAQKLTVSDIMFIGRMATRLGETLDAINEQL